MDKEATYTLYCKYYEELSIDDNLIFVESHNSMDLAGNMFYIIKEIDKNDKFSDYHVSISVTEKSIDKVMKYIENYSLSRVSLLIRESEEYIKTLATAKYLFTDVAFYPLYRKKKGQKCITTWHGTPLKTLGYTYWQDSYVVPNQKRGFLLSDYFICPNEYTWECIRKSYELDTLYKGKALFNGYPRNATLLDKNKAREIRKEMNINDNKKIVVYMPTWRGKVIDVDDKKQSDLLQVYLDELDKLIPNDYEVWAKLHRLNEVNLDYSNYEHIKKFPCDYETYELLNVADILVTDYSSVMFDFAVTTKKIVLFCYDKHDYITNRKCYFDIEELPFPIAENVEQLVDEIVLPKKYNDEKFIRKFCGEESLNSTEKMLETILYDKDLVRYKRDEKKQNNKKLVFVGDLRESKDTDALFDFLGNQNRDSIYVSYMSHLFLKKPYKLLQLKNYNKVPLYMFQGMYSTFTKADKQIIMNIKEAIAENRKIDKEIWEKFDEIYSRELERFTYQNRFEIFIKFAGLDLESLKFFSVFRGKKILYIQDNMLEKSLFDNEFFTFLHRAMSKADVIYYANEKIFNSADKLNTNVHAKKVIAYLY